MKKAISFVFFLAVLFVGYVIGVRGVSGVVEIEISPIYSYELPDKEYGFTCTGLTKATDGSWWIGSYGKETPESSSIQPSLVNVSNDFKVIRDEINRDGSDNIQGLAFDNKTNSIWFSNGKEISNVSLTGEVISSFRLPKSNVVPNGVAYNEQDDSIWVLGYEDYLYGFTKRGELIDLLSIDYPDQDHICFDENGDLWFSYGADYLGKNNYVCKYDIVEGRVEVQYKVLNSYAIEGIYIDNNLLFVANDGVYHQSKDGKNIINVYSLK